MRRRSLLLTLAAVVGSGCVRPAQRQAQPAAPPDGLPQAEALTTTARSILTDALEALRVFDAFAAYRISTAESSSFRTPSELAWDPPGSADWDEATRVATGTHGRAEQVLVALARAPYDPAAWRERRAFGDAVHELVDLGDALSAYRLRIDGLAPRGDGSSALELLDNAWRRWDIAAARWSLSRAEALATS